VSPSFFPFFLFNPRLPGLRFETLNFHLLLHLVQCVRRYGPLWTTSCFPFETANGFLVQCLTGTNSSVINMLTSARCLMNVRVITEIVQNPGCLDFVLDLLGESIPPRQVSPIFEPSLLSLSLFSLLHLSDFLLLLLLFFFFVFFFFGESKFPMAKPSPLGPRVSETASQLTSVLC